jgi:hypothetical protein
MTNEKVQPKKHKSGTRIVFKNARVFGEGFDTTFRTVVDVVGGLFTSGKLEVATGAVNRGTLTELWTYIYYLYNYNNGTVAVFKAMKKGEFASASKFYKVVQVATGTEGRPVTEKTLKAFINDVIAKQKPMIPNIPTQPKQPRQQPKQPKQPSNIVANTVAVDAAAAAAANANARLESAKQIDILQRELAVCHEAAAELQTQKPTPNPEQVATYERRIADLEAKVREAVDSANAANARRTDLEKLSDMIKQEVAVDTNDVGELVSLLKRRLQAATAVPPNSLVAKRRDCSADIAAFKKHVEQTVQSIILTKLCIIKLIGTVVGASADASQATVLACKDPDDGALRAQVANFKRLPGAKQKAYKDMYVANRNEILTYRDRFTEIATSVITNCEDLDAIKAEYARSLDQLRTLVGSITNINEDLLGSVRVFVKLRKFVEGLDDRAAANAVSIEVRDNTQITVNCGGSVVIGNFFGVFDERYGNADMYSGSLNTKTDGLIVPAAMEEARSWSLRKTFDQLQDGYSICMLTMGYSGSGKSYGFFGGKDEPGIVHYGLANMSKSNGSNSSNSSSSNSVTIQYVFELYYDTIDILKKTFKTKVIVGYDRTNDLIESLAKYGVTNIEHDPINIKVDATQPGTDINAFVNDNMKAITDHQRERGRIKRTANNDASSRSHLFVVLNVHGKSFLTVCDLAGFENAMTIYAKMFSDKMSLPYFLMQFDSDGLFRGIVRNETIGHYLKDTSAITNANQFLKKGDAGELKFVVGKGKAGALKPRMESSLQKNVQVVMESFFVVESLLHMCYYFNQRNGVKKAYEFQKYAASSIVYDTGRVFVSPEAEDTNRVEKKVNMIPILKFINDLGKADTVSKFILYGAIRPDRCSDNTDTIKYLASVASTST